MDINFLQHKNKNFAIELYTVVTLLHYLEQYDKSSKSISACVMGYTV